MNFMVEDIKRLDRMLPRDERELRQVLGAVSSTIVVLNPNETLRYANQAVFDYSGVTIDALLAREGRAHLFHSDDVSKLAVKRREALLSNSVPARGAPPT